jgi:hypothetical protein
MCLVLIPYQSQGRLFLVIPTLGLQHATSSSTDRSIAYRRSPVLWVHCCLRTFASRVRVLFLVSLVEMMLDLVHTVASAFNHTVIRMTS